MNKDTGPLQMNQLLQHEGTKALLQDVAGNNETIKQWIGRLELLGDIPFQNLIADDKLLPQNALRFFYLDPSWKNALIDGALSIGTNTTLEEQISGILAETMRGHSALNAYSKRAKLLKMGHMVNTTPPTEDKPVAGMLLRSELVNAFPGLKIIATYDEGEDPNQIPTRYEKLTSDLLIVFFPLTPKSIKIQQPPHGLQFGFSQTDPNLFRIKLRHVFGPQTGEPIKVGGQAVTVDINEAVLWRATTGEKRQVLDIDALKAKVQESLIANKAYPTPVVDIIPPQFVMQIINAPDETTFTNASKLVPEPTPPQSL